MTQTQIDLDKIRTGGGTQPRVQLNETAVAEYAEALTEGAKLPPVTVFFDGSDYWLADGFHRYHAHRKIGALQIPSDVRDGTRRDAVLHSVGANAEHGLRRSNEDKRRAVLTLIEDEEWGKWSDREIARRCGVSPQTVGNVRHELSVQNGQIDTPRTVERNGTVYKQNTTNIGSGKNNKTSVQKGSPPASSQNTPPDPKPEPPSETEILRAELADLQDRYNELLSQYEEVVADNASMAAAFEADDKIKEALAEAKKYRELNRIAEERIRGLMNEKNEAIRAAKRWQRQAQKAA